MRDVKGESCTLILRHVRGNSGATEAGEGTRLGSRMVECEAGLAVHTGSCSRRERCEEAGTRDGSTSASRGDRMGEPPEEERSGAMDPGKLACRGRSGDAARGRRSRISAEEAIEPLRIHGGFLETTADQPEWRVAEDQLVDEP